MNVEGKGVFRTRKVCKSSFEQAAFFHHNFDFGVRKMRKRNQRKMKRSTRWDLIRKRRGNLLVNQSDIPVDFFTCRHGSPPPESRKRRSKPCSCSHRSLFPLR